MPRFAIRLEYDGTPYMGWQYQEHGPSVQGAVIDAFREFTGETLTVHASGRTDAGVHALGQVIHVDIEGDRFDANRIREALNGCLRPHPISALEVIEVDERSTPVSSAPGEPTATSSSTAAPGWRWSGIGLGWCARRWTPKPCTRPHRPWLGTTILRLSAQSSVRPRPR